LLRQTGRESPLTDLGNDRWGASFTVAEPGEYEYTVEGWIRSLRIVDPRD
jgi:hypothetical protein